MKGKRFLALLLSAVMTMSMGIPAAAAENSEETLENQVLDLKFEDNLDDSSTKGNNGTISSGTAEYVDGVVGQALKLNGDKYVDLGNEYRSAAGESDTLFLAEAKWDNERGTDYYLE